ncbi:MAG TPA: hypothetical protein VF421_08110 [Niabella sp.]
MKKFNPADVLNIPLINAKPVIKWQKDVQGHDKIAAALAETHLRIRFAQQSAYLGDMQEYIVR